MYWNVNQITCCGFGVCRCRIWQIVMARWGQNTEREGRGPPLCVTARFIVMIVRQISNHFLNEPRGTTAWRVSSVVITYVIDTSLDATYFRHYGLNSRQAMSFRLLFIFDGTWAMKAVFLLRSYTRYSCMWNFLLYTHNTHNTTLCVYLYTATLGHVGDNESACEDFVIQVMVVLTITKVLHKYEFG